MRTHGTLKLSRDRQWWHVDCEPHVRIKLKHVFARIAKGAHGVLKLAATDEVSRDLQWFMERFPFVVDAAAARVLDGRARAYDQRADRAAEILNGIWDHPTVITMALPPRDYQAQAAALAISAGGLLLADDLGLGKTVSGITMLAHGTTPALVVCPVHLQRQWAEQVFRFTPSLHPHIIKSRTVYPIGDGNGRLPDVLISSYHKLNGWADHLAGRVRSVIFDEVQELRKRDSDKYKAAHFIAARAEYRLGLSGTPIYNYGDEFFSVIDVLRPGALGTHAEFAREWLVGAEDKAEISDPKAFGAMLRDQAMLLRRTKEQVGRELPKLTKVVHEIEADLAQLKKIEGDAIDLAKTILSQGESFDRMKASSEFSNRLRQATGIAKAPFVAEFVRMLLEEGRPVLLFGWHRVVYQIWGERLRQFKPAFYTGAESDSKKASEAKRFIDGQTNLMVMSLRSGAGVDGLQARCSTVVFGELDWSPGAMDQCVGRAHREGQDQPVFAYYLTASDGCDPYMTDALGLKRQQIEGVRDPDAELVEGLEVDPDHVKNLARDYLRKRGQRA